MSRSKLFNMIKSRGTQPNSRNPFDLSNKHVYTQKVAKITPVKAFHTIPDDYLQVTMKEFSQNLIPMNTAAFLDGKKELLAYFVPYNTIWHNYNQYQATREDPESAALKVKGISYEPRFRLFDLYRSALYFAIGAWFVEEYCKVLMTLNWYRNRVPNSEAWRRMVLAYGQNVTISELIEFLKNSHFETESMSDYDYWLRKTIDDYTSDTFSSFDRQHGWPMGITFSCYESTHNEDPTYASSIMNMFGTPIWCDWMQKLDMLGYGNIWPILKIWRNKMDIVVNRMLTDDGIHFNQTSAFYDAEGTVYLDSVILDGFFVDSPSAVASVFGDFTTNALNKLLYASSRPPYAEATDDEYVNVYALYAYNKCFYDYMRNVYFDLEYSVFNYNCDFADCSDWESSIIHPNMLPIRFYHLESHQWKKDMFTGVLPDNQLGAISQVSLTFDRERITSQTSSVSFTKTGSAVKWAASDNSFSGNLKANSGVFSSDNDANLRIENAHTHSLQVDIPPRTASFDVLALKRAEALQEYAQDLMRAGNRTQDIFNAIYGVTPKSQLDEAPYFIDVASADLDINPIISTANTGTQMNGKLGDIAARSTINGYNSPLHFKFSTKDFGVVLFLSYIVPNSFYNSYRLDPMVTHLDPESHMIPYFQNLGLQPVYGSFLNNLMPADVRHTIRGYAPPYLEFKTDVDLVHGSLVDSYLPKATEDDIDSEFQGELSHWVVARTDMQQEKVLSLRNFYIDPRIVDNVFQFEAGSDYSTDHYLTYADLKIECVRALTEIGLPRF